MFRGVRQFSVAVVKNMMAKFPFKDPVVRNLGFLDPERRDDITSSAGRYLQKQLSKLVLLKILVTHFQMLTGMIIRQFLRFC